jgi:hypothetical protein
MDFDQRPLAEAVVDDPPQCAPDGIAYNVIVSTGAGGQLVERALEAVSQGVSRTISPF